MCKTPKLSHTLDWKNIFAIASDNYLSIYYFRENRPQVRTDTFQKFDLIQCGLCERWSTLHHLQSHKTLRPACRQLWLSVPILFRSFLFSYAILRTLKVVLTSHPSRAIQWKSDPIPTFVVLGIGWQTLPQSLQGNNRL